MATELSAAAAPATAGRRWPPGIGSSAPDRRHDRLRVAIVGAGATGVELAAKLRHVVHKFGRYSRLDARSQLAMTLIDRAPRILSTAGPRTSAYALETIERLGVEVQLNASVAAVTPNAVRLVDAPPLPGVPPGPPRQTDRRQLPRAMA